MKDKHAICGTNHNSITIKMYHSQKYADLRSIFPTPYS